VLGNKIMKKISSFRFLTSLLLCFSLLASPMFLLAGDKEAKKRFNEGLKYEYAEDWDKAVEHFAMAVTENPKNAEYKLHYTRALFNASQMYMKKGNNLAEQKDYEGAYNHYRKAYSYDQTNELAKAMMEKMLRLRQADDAKEDDKNNPSTNGIKLQKTSYNSQQKDDFYPQKIEKLRDVIYQNEVDLQWLIKELSKDLDLNVLFDKDTFRTSSKVKIELRSVTSAKALDYLFLQEGLFFQKVGPRTIVVANQNQRVKFQQLVLKTFYLSNAAPKDVAKIIPTAIPPQPGRGNTTVLTDEATNSVTIRDTEENIRLIGKLIRSLDKDRAEVVMDVNIYEVTKNDLLQLGNQIGDDKSLINLGGTTTGAVGLGGNDIFGNLTKIPTAFGAGVILPGAQIQALQSKGNTRLLASTQVHAFNNEESTARIGQRVPVVTASVFPAFGSGNQNGGGIGGGFPVVNYEQTGLTLKFTPLVFPNQDVQVKMEIESKDLGAPDAEKRPTFVERSIKGTARIQNNRTLLLASVAQDNQSNARTGLPLVGLIPILGRLFSSPSKTSRQTDIVIAVTPKVLRAPTILPEDEDERQTGSQMVPTNNSLEAMIKEEEREEFLAETRRKNNIAIQLPDQIIETAPNYVPNNNSGVAVESKVIASKKSETKITTTNTGTEQSGDKEVSTPDVTLKLIDSSNLRTLRIAPTSDNSDEKLEVQKTSAQVSNTENQLQADVPTAEMQIFYDMKPMKTGDKMTVSVIIKSNSSLRSAVLGLNFDPKKVAVRKVVYGDLFGSSLAEKQATPYFNSKGKIYVTLNADKEIVASGSDVLAYLEIESLVDGTPEIKFDTNVNNVLADDGGSFLIKYR
jgi:general secretion pathway protein D